MKELIEKYQKEIAEIESYSESSNDSAYVAHCRGLIAVMQGFIKDLESLQPKGKTKEEVWRITAENKFPICYKIGDWDGKRSDLCLCVDTEGEYHLATCYESNREFEWYDKNDFGLRHDVVKWAYVESIEEYANQQQEAEKEGWVSDKMPDFDGKYLCLIEQVQECGAVWEYQKVVDCIMNTWVLIDREKVIKWRKLPQP